MFQTKSSMKGFRLLYEKQNEKQNKTISKTKQKKYEKRAKINLQTS